MPVLSSTIAIGSASSGSGLIRHDGPLHASLRRRREHAADGAAGRVREVDVHAVRDDARSCRIDRSRSGRSDTPHRGTDRRGTSARSGRSCSGRSSSWGTSPSSCRRGSRTRSHWSVHSAVAGARDVAATAVVDVACRVGAEAAAAHRAAGRCARSPPSTWHRAGAGELAHARRRRRGVPSFEAAVASGEGVGRRVRGSTRRRRRDRRRRAICRGATSPSSSVRAAAVLLERMRGRRARRASCSRRATQDADEATRSASSERQASAYGHRRLSELPPARRSHRR